LDGGVDATTPALTPVLWAYTPISAEAKVRAAVIGTVQGPGTVDWALFAVSTSACARTAFGAFVGRFSNDLAELPTGVPTHPTSRPTATIGSRISFFMDLFVLVEWNGGVLKAQF
jgi:hypothetical protein